MIALIKLLTGSKAEQRFAAPARTRGALPG